MTKKPNSAQLPFFILYTMIQSQGREDVFQSVAVVEEPRTILWLEGVYQQAHANESGQILVV